MSGDAVSKPPRSIDHDLATWLAATTGDDVQHVEQELYEGERRRVFVVDELIDAGFMGSELLGLTLRLTGLATAEGAALIEERAGLAAAAAKQPEAPKRDRMLMQNEIVFREVNERLARAAGSPTAGLDLVCECSDRSCLAVFTMPAGEYEWLRQNPLHFAVLPGHEAPAIERVVERHPSFVVVEKHPATHDQAAATDPRA
jgi:hypothetical protein